MPKISVVMACYNRKEYIGAAVESILNQSFNDFEFIIVDDCSTDGTREIIENYAQKDSRIKLFKNQTNKGLIYNLRLGIENAQGEYIVRMDDDDISLPERFKKQIEFMEANPDITVCGSFISLIGDCLGEQGWVKHTSPEEISILLNFFNPMCHPSVIIRKSFLEKHNINFRYEALHAEEYDLWKQIVINNGKLANLPEVLLLYRVHKKRISQLEESSRIQNITAQKVKAELLSRFFSKKEVDNIVKKIYMYPFEKNNKKRLYTVLKKMILKDTNKCLDNNAMNNIINTYCRNSKTQNVSKDIFEYFSNCKNKAFYEFLVTNVKNSIDYSPFFYIKLGFLFQFKWLRNDKKITILGIPIFREKQKSWNSKNGRILGIRIYKSKIQPIYPLRNIIKENRISEFLDTKYVFPFLENKLEKYQIVPKKNLNTDKIIWQFWAQGIETAPNIVKVCFNSVDKYKGEYTVIRLTEESIQEYIDLPDFVIEKFKNKQFGYAHFSDLLRICLLSAYGGIWIDATILLTDHIKQEYLEQDFFSFQRTKRPKDYKMWEEYNKDYFVFDKNFKVKWLNSFIIAKKGNCIVNALKDIILNFWENENCMEEYFTMQYMFDTLVKYEPYKSSNKLKVSDLPPHLMQFNFYKKYTPELWQKILSQSSIHKLTYKGLNFENKDTILNNLINRKKIGILAIALGRYTVFWEDFYKTCEKNFLDDCDKTYYLFTDNKNIKFKDCKNVKYIPYEKKGWPYDSMMRFDMFLEHEPELSQEDYLFFFNIDVLFTGKTGREILPTDANDGLMTGSHANFYDKEPDLFTYDRNPASTAYIPYGQGKHYATGAINGGTSKAFLELAKVCSKNTHIDLDNGVIALWHDESHLNKYLLDKNPLIMPINYLYPMWKPKEWLKTNEFSNDVRIMIRRKFDYKYGGHAYLRGEIDVKYSKFNKILYKILSKIAITPKKRRFYREIERKLVKY